MDKEAFGRHLAYAGEVRPSMKRRADAHDYHERRIYMITIAVEGRRPRCCAHFYRCPREKGT